MFQNHPVLLPPCSSQGQMALWIARVYKELIWNWNTQDRKVDNELFKCFRSAAVRLPRDKLAFLHFLQPRCLPRLRFTLRYWSPCDIICTYLFIHCSHPLSEGNVQGISLVIYITGMYSPSGITSWQQLEECLAHSRCSVDICIEWMTSDTFFFFFLIYLFIFIFGCVGSLLLHGLSLVTVSRGYSSLRCVGFSLRWLLLLQSTGSRHVGFSSCGTRA